MKLGPKDGKPMQDDHERGFVHEADSVAYNLAHAMRHIQAAQDKANGMTKKIKKHGVLRKEAVKLAATKSGVLSR